MSSSHCNIIRSKFKRFFLEFFLEVASFYSRIYRIWSEGMPYSTWQKLLKRHLNCLRSGRFPCGCRKKGGARGHKRLCSLEEEQRNKAVQSLSKEPKVYKEPNEDITLELITMLKQFLEKKGIVKHVEEVIPDSRNQSLITYSKESIMMSALAIFLFRMGSGNSFQTKTHDNDEKYSRTNTAKFINAPENRVPVIKTIEKFLKNLEVESINQLMIAFFKDLQASKFFMHHPEIKIGDVFLLAADCIHTHTYDHPHRLDMEGNNTCDCCLKRVYNKGTENEKVRWMHNTLVFSFVFAGGLKIPIYQYPIHAKQLVGLEGASEDTYKQECEIVALKMALPVIRKTFPKMEIALLLDGLYANKPIIRLAEENRCEYIIVRKEASLPILARECDERALHSNHRKNCVKNCRKVTDTGWHISQKYAWFNNMYLGDGITTHVLRFAETRTKEGEEIQSYKGEWIFSQRLSARTCETAAQQARMRWEEEDLFNTLKKRNFNIKHDYSRDPRSCFHWQGLALLAFGIFELFRFSEAVKQRGDWPQTTLADKLLGQLLHRPTEELFPRGFQAKRIQFRYHFSIPSTASAKCLQSPFKRYLNTG